MSPASYRAAPPRVAPMTLRQRGEAPQIAVGAAQVDVSAERPVTSSAGGRRARRAAGLGGPAGGALSGRQREGDGPDGRRGWAVPPVALGDGLGEAVEPPDPPWAASAREIASWSSVWACPYAAKSPLASAAFEASMAASASASA